MIKKILFRAGFSFMTGITGSLIICILVIAIADKPDFNMMVPEFAARFSSPYLAFGVQLLLLGVISAAFGGSSVIYDIERWSFLKQGIIHFLVTVSIWLPISIFCWKPAKYISAAVSTLISFLFTYVLTWILRYIQCKEAINKINTRIEELNSTK